MATLDSKPKTATTKEGSLGVLSLAALGVVYGDIGTSPLYVMKTVFDPAHGLAITNDNIMGVISLIFWAIMMVVTVKYVTLMLRADNHGEGGIMALLALASLSIVNRPQLHHILFMIGAFGAALFYGDGVITPAISVLSAVEGLEVATPLLQPYVLPLYVGPLNDPCPPTQAPPRRATRSTRCGRFRRRWRASVPDTSSP